MSKLTQKGRPTKYTTDLAQEICSAIASTSIGTKKLCKQHSHWPCQDTLFTWLKAYPEFSEQYAQAKRCQAEVLVDEILEIADDATRDQCINLQGKTVLNNQAISRARLRIDTRKWLVGKLLPKIYGNRVEYHSHVSSIQKEGLDELSNYIEELERKYHREY